VDGTLHRSTDREEEGKFVTKNTYVFLMHPTLEEMKKPTPWNKKKSSKIINFVYRVPGKDLVVVAGFFR